MTNLDSILKSRGITLSTKVRLVKAMVFPVVMYGCAAPAKSFQSSLTLCDPIDSSPPGSPIPGFLQARTLEWIAISFSNARNWKVKVNSLSRVQLLAIPCTEAYQAPPSRGFSRQMSTGVGCQCLLRYGCESWTIKKVEHQRIDAFELWCWRRLLRVPWTARRSNQSILNEISPGCLLVGLMLKLKLQYFGHLMQKAD